MRKKWGVFTFKERRRHFPNQRDKKRIRDGTSLCHNVQYILSSCFTWNTPVPISHNSVNFTTLADMYENPYKNLICRLCKPLNSMCQRKFDENSGRKHQANGQKHALNMFHHHHPTTLIMMEFSVIMSEYEWRWLQINLIIAAAAAAVHCEICSNQLLINENVLPFNYTLSHIQQLPNALLFSSNFACQYWLVICVRAYAYIVCTSLVQFLKRWNEKNKKKYCVPHTPNEYKALSFIHI